jgi:predicted NBD/HSP70 family sugar kinase
MSASAHPVVAGIDLGGTAVNYTFIDSHERWLIEGLCEHPSRSKEGPDVCLQQIADGLEMAVASAGITTADVVVVGLDTPGPASSAGVLSARGSTNFVHPAWAGFDLREGLAHKLGKPVTYLNDGNAGALWGHFTIFGASARETSISAIVGTGLGGGVIESGHIVKGAAGMAGELGHVHIPMAGLLDEGQPVPQCNCGFAGDAESVASLTGIEKNLLPYWLSRHPEHELAQAGSLAEAAKRVRSFGVKGDPLARRIFEQQAMALGRLFTIAANFTDPHAYFVGGGVVEAETGFREWFLAKVREHTGLREEQARAARFELVPDLDMAGARGAALAAFEYLRVP